ncbi:SHOCT domain-containing protein [Amycolatopsis sp. NPDC003676]
MTSDVLLLQFKSHIAGKNATVQIFPDRVEWERPRGVSGGKLTAGLLTSGVSLLATGVRSGRAGTEMIPIKNVSSVTTKRDGLRFTAVKVVTSGNTIDFRVGHNEAGPIKDLLTELVLGSHPSQQAPASSEPAVAAPTTEPSDTPASATSSLAADLEKLAELRERGILTDEEFAMQKSRLLGG